MRGLMKKTIGDISASGLIAAYDAVGGFIEKHTQAVCPSCESVCCIDRHGTYEPEDLVLLQSLGLEPHHERQKENDTGPCRFLSANGCGLPRWQRPFRCTWYFCTCLLDAMPLKNPKEYREFVGALDRLVNLRNTIIQKC